MDNRNLLPKNDSAGIRVYQPSTRPARGELLVALTNIGYKRLMCREKDRVFYDVFANGQGEKAVVIFPMAVHRSVTITADSEEALNIAQEYIKEHRGLFQETLSEEKNSKLYVATDNFGRGYEIILINNSKRQDSGTRKKSEELGNKLFDQTKEMWNQN